MRLAIKNKVVYGFLIVAFGMLLTDAYHIYRAPSGPAASVASSATHLRRF
jgi:hypothetical protein